MGFVQILYCTSFALLLLFSWGRSRAILHPHFLFCLMLLVISSDFMIRGNDDPNIIQITGSELTQYQLLTLATLMSIGASTAMVRKPYELKTEFLQPPTRIATTTASVILLIGAAVFAVQQIYRLVIVDWSFQELFNQMVAPYNSKVWFQPNEAGVRDPVYQLISGMIPLVATSFAFLIYSRKWLVSLAAAILFVATEIVLVTDGARTQAIFPVASLGVFGIMTYRRLAPRVAAVTISVGLIVVMTSAMYIFRGSGLYGTTSSFSVEYHQDDSIYRLWSACAFADASQFRWDPFYFFYYIVSLPIPRAIWSAKPLLDANFYGPFKLWFVTTTFMGEWISMLGVTTGFIVSFAFANTLYRGFYSAQRLLTMPMGIAAYLLSALYMYSVLRSMPNLTAFIFAPAAGVFIVAIARRSVRTRSGATRKRPRAAEFNR